MGNIPCEKSAMGMYDVRSSVISNVHPCEPSGHFRPTTPEAHGLPRQAKPVIPVGAKRPLEPRLVPTLYAPSVERVDTTQLRICDSYIVPAVDERQRLMLEEDPSHR